MAKSRSLLLRRQAAAVLAGSIGVAMLKTIAATYTWKDPNQGGPASGTWSTAANWTGNVAPPGNNTIDELVFGGPVAADTGAVNPIPAYVSTNDRTNFTLNRFTLTATDPDALTADVPHNITGNLVTLTGTNPSIVQNGAGPVTFNLPIRFAANTTLTGNGAGAVTLNNTVSGFADLTKVGSSTFRFGSQVVASVEQPSNNTWYGRLVVSQGTVRFNNNATAARTALRGNPVVMAAAGTLTASSELRMGVLSGAGGTVATEATGTDENSNSIVIHALDAGVYDGTLRIGAPTGAGTPEGDLIVRGPGTQTFTMAQASSTLNTNGGDIQVGFGSTVVLADNATFSTGAAGGGVILNGGTFNLNNRGVDGNAANDNDNDRLRGLTSDVDVTGLETIGGGTFSLIGNGTSGSSELMARLQLGSVNNTNTVSTARSGGLTINVTHTAAANPTVLGFTAYTRSNASVLQDTTVDFTANNLAGTALELGQSGNNPRIIFNGVGFTVQTVNNTLNNTGGIGADVGWATINGSDFAGYSATPGIGVVPVVTTDVNTLGTNGSATANFRLTASTNTINALSGFEGNTVEIDRAMTAGQSLTVNTTFTTKGLSLGGAQDFTINGSGTYAESSFAGSKNRYFHVKQATLAIDIPIGGTGAIVKAGNGTLALNNVNNAAVQTTINGGVVRASTASLPGGQLEFRGGVYEIDGGGTFNRALGTDVGQVNWSGFDPINGSVGQDRGSGGFAARGGDAIVDLNTLGTRDNIAWENDMFVNSGHALVFGSATADSRVEWRDNLSLTATSGAVNYNAREIRVNDNPSSSGDYASISGNITGTVHNDLLKTGSGVLQIAGTANNYTGATVVHGGTLLVNSAIYNRATQAGSFVANVRPGATLGGNGTVGPVRLDNATSVANASNLSPGNLPGNTSILSTTDLFFGGTNTKLTIEIGGLAVGGNSTNGYDRVDVIGGITLNSAQLQGSMLNNYTPNPNDLFFIMINDGVDAVQGTFAQGSQIFLSGRLFQILYSANSTTNAQTGGNDVALRYVPEPSAGIFAMAGMAVLFGRRRRQK